MARLYIAGPMRGIPEFNFPRFDWAELVLTTAGHATVSPAQHDREEGFDPAGMDGNEDLGELGFDLKAALGWDLEQVANADGVAVLDGWERSSGARAEVATAHALGIPVATVHEWLNSGNRAYITSDAPRSDNKPQEYHVIRAKAVQGSSREALDRINDTGEVRTTSATGGQKGTKPERYDLIPIEALAHVARLYGAGAAKYSAHNWRKGYEWSKSYAAMQRHATQFWAGEDIDPEMGTPHLASVIFHAMALLVFMDEQPGYDDRYTTTRERGA